MICLLTRSQLDAAAYDRCVAGSPDRIIYAFSWYLDAVSPDWQVLVLNEYEAVMPLPVRTRYGINGVVQPLFCHQLGVFSANEPTPPDRLKAFLTEAGRHFRYISSYQFHAANTAMLPRQPEFTGRTNHVLDLREPYETLRSRYSRGRRHHLKRPPQPPEWTLTDTTDIGPLFDLFLQYNTRGIGRVDPTAGPVLHRLTSALLERRCARIRVAQRNGRIEAGSLLVIDQRRIIHLFCAASPDGRRSNARMFILDELVREFAGQHRLLDFESPEAEPLARFNQEFGAVAEPYARWTRNQLPAAIQWLHRLKTTIHRTFYPR